MRPTSLSHPVHEDSDTDLVLTMMFKACPPASVLVLYLLCYVGAQPSIRWVRQLSGGGTLSSAGVRRGNGVEVARNGMTVWVTDDEGSVHILDAHNASREELVFIPTPMEGRTTESRSKACICQNETSLDFAVYAIVDVASDDSTETQISSRVIAIHGEAELLGTLKWQVAVEGVAAGSPQLGFDCNHVYITHNAKQTGHFSILDKNGNLIDQTSKARNFGPVTVSSSGGIDTTYWGEAEGMGYSSLGRIYQYTTPTWLSRVGDEVISSTVIPPTVWREGKRSRMWLGGRSATVHGWTDKRQFGAAPNWSRQLATSQRNESFPIINEIAASVDGSRIYVSSASNTFYCLNAKVGNIRWSATGRSNYLNDPILSPGGRWVYIIESVDGTIEKRSALDGRLLWRFSCREIPGRHRSCQDSVEAGFSLSDDGGILYYSDIWGTITSLEVDTLTTMPSFLPSVLSYSSPSGKLSSSIAAFVPSSGPSAVSSLNHSPSFPSIEPPLSPSSEEATNPSKRPTKVEVDEENGAPPVKLNRGEAESSSNAQLKRAVDASIANPASIPHPTILVLFMLVIINHLT